MTDQVQTLEAASTQAREEPLAFGTILTYSLPTVGAGYMFLLVGLYLMKFATDVLLIAPAAMSAIFGLSRVWGRRLRSDRRLPERSHQPPCGAAPPVALHQLHPDRPRLCDGLCAPGGSSGCRARRLDGRRCVSLLLRHDRLRRAAHVARRGAHYRLPRSEPDLRRSARGLDHWLHPVARRHGPAHPGRGGRGSQLAADGPTARAARVCCDRVADPRRIAAPPRATRVPGTRGPEAL